MSISPHSPKDFVSIVRSLANVRHPLTSQHNFVVFSSPTSLRSQQMPSVPTVSPATGNSVPSYFIHTTSDHFVDTSGRTVLLRGVNLSGDSKFPAGTASHVLEGFWEGGESGDVSFIGRPFSLKEADVHLERLRGWGMNLIRYVICWEALEHAGP